MAALGDLLRHAFADADDKQLPQAFLDLLALLAIDSASGPRALADAEFKAALTGLIPQLRSYARVLTRDAERGDDLVQDTLLKAWAARQSFAAGPNMRAWTFTIQRRVYLTAARRLRFTGEWDEALATKLLATPAGQERPLELADVRRGLGELPPPQREALLLIGAGFAYDEVAEICRVSLGSIKSRVGRGRAALEEVLATGPARREDVLPKTQTSAFDAMMKEIDELVSA